MPPPSRLQLPLLTRPQKAQLSWLIDAGTSVAVLALLSAWVSDIRGHRANYISESFLENGFCLSPLFDSTHITCSLFDSVGGGLFVAVGILSGPKMREFLLPVAAYLFSHAYGHYVGGTELTEPGAMDGNEETMPLKDLLVLAAICSIGPIDASRCLVEAGAVTKKVANGMAVVALTGLVGIYATYLRKPRFALLYINISLLLMACLPRALAIGYTSEIHVALRADTPLWYANHAVGMLVGTIVFAEPFFCDDFVAGIGGHLLFDVSLMLQVVVGAMIHHHNAAVEKNPSSETEKLKAS